MENFIDRLAQRLVSQESMQANLDADALEAEALKEQAALLKEQGDALKEQIDILNRQLAEYQDISQTMKRIQIKNVELSEKINQVCDFSLQKMEEAEAADPFDEEEDAEEKARAEQLQTWQENLEAHVHRECVKVYKNVQAVVEEQSAKTLEEANRQLSEQTQKLKTAVAELEAQNAKKHKVTRVWVIVTFVMALLGVALQVLEQFGVLDYWMSFLGM
ncbi:MAG: hypothetical protein LUI10_04240 [Lachnospiraceae bacterium]|nr:hypothetical protein [Lachnospiraceae bacterium]